MVNKKSPVTLLFIFALSVAVSFAQKNLRYRFQYLMIEDGLPQNTINAIEKDEYGYMWFGTNNGVCRYDAYKIEVFSEHDHSPFFADKMINALEASDDGRLWIGTSLGLSYFDHVQQEFVKLCDQSSEFCGLQKITALLYHSDSLWVGTANNGLFLLIPDGDRNYRIADQFSVQNERLRTNTILSICRSSDGSLFVGTTNEALVYAKASGKFIQRHNNRILPAGLWVRNIFESRVGDMYFSTTNGLFRFRKGHDIARYYSLNLADEYSLIHNGVAEVQEDRLGNILVASLGGLQKLDTATERFYTFPLDGPDNFKIINKFVNTLFCDSSGNVWLGTEKGGINKFNIYQNRFRFFVHDSKDPYSLNENTINSILKEENTLWVGTAGGGLNKIDVNTGKATHLTQKPQDNNSLSSNYITSLVRGQNDKLWVATWGGGLNEVDTQNGRTTTYRLINGGGRYKHTVANPFISSLVNDPRGYLLVGTEGGLSMLNYKTKQITTLLAPEGFPEQLSEIGCVMLDSKGYYWVGTRNGLFRFPASSVRPTDKSQVLIDYLQYFHNDSNSNSIPGDFVISLLEDSYGHVWVGTYGYGPGKCTINEQGQLSCESFGKNQGLHNLVAYNMLEDNDRKIWISTDHGLYMYNPEKDNFRSFFEQDGLLSNQFYWSAAHKGNQGELYFGTVKGLNYFTPHNFGDYNFTAPPRITQFSVHNKAISPFQTLHNTLVMNKAVYAADTFALTYRDNNIAFEFSSFDFYLPEKLRFAYKMSGVDKDWIEVPASRRFANYNNLSGGKYTFSVKSTDSDGNWTKKQKNVTLIISPPFWKTTWFKISISILVLLVTYLQMDRFFRQKNVLEDKVRRRTKKIEDQNEMLGKQAAILTETNLQLEERQKQIEQQKVEMETKNDEISSQRDELILLNDKVNNINQMQLRFFTNISHEFRTPLTLIISPIERLLKRFEGDDETVYLLNTINRSANRLLMLIRQLLEIRKIETGNQNLQVELTETRTFLLEIFGAFEELAQKNEINYTHDIKVTTTAWVDKVKLENVLYNLLSNAFKFTPQGNRITLKAFTEKQQNEELLTISVIDTGEGIAKDQMHKLFDRFHQVTESKKSKRMGTGIGLSMVKSLVEIMYGTIEVDSTPNVGSAFTVQVPVNRELFANHEIDTTGQVYESNIKDKVAILYDQITEQPTVNYNADSSAVDTVLVVEDNFDMRSFICSSLAPYYRVLEAPDGETGYELAKKEDPSLIVSDIMMPGGISGLELCKKTKSNLHTSHIPVILLTARSKVADFVEGLELGADDYLTKPFNIEILVAKINGLIDNRNKLRERFSTLEDFKSSDASLSDLDSKFFAKVNEIIEKFYTDSAFDVDQFASEMFVSRSQLYTKMKAITGLSANEFLNTYRLRKSVELLKDGQMQISEIAYATGFNDPKYFSRIFKKFYKASPSEFKRKPESPQAINEE